MDPCAARTADGRRATKGRFSVERPLEKSQIDTSGVRFGGRTALQHAKRVRRPRKNPLGPSRLAVTRPEGRLQKCKSWPWRPGVCLPKARTEVLARLLIQASSDTTALNHQSEQAFRPAHHQRCLQACSAGLTQVQYQRPTCTPGVPTVRPRSSFWGWRVPRRISTGSQRRFRAGVHETVTVCQRV